MELAGELSKIGLSSLLQLSRNCTVTGEIKLNQLEREAIIYLQHGDVVHVYSDGVVGKEALLELFLWQGGNFALSEKPLSEVPSTIETNYQIEHILYDGQQLIEHKKYLDQYAINGETILKPLAASSSAPEEFPLLGLLDGKKSLAHCLVEVKLPRARLISVLYDLLSKGWATVTQPPVAGASGGDFTMEQTRQAPGAVLAAQPAVKETGYDIVLPDWVEARLKQDNPDLSKAIVELVIWADRVKCWLYQADSDLLNLAEEIEFAGTDQEQGPKADSGPGLQAPAQRNEDAANKEAQQGQNAVPQEVQTTPQETDDPQNILPSRMARLARRQQRSE